jgi:hypothetical protein
LLSWRRPAGQQQAAQQAASTSGLRLSYRLLVRHRWFSEDANENRRTTDGIAPQAQQLDPPQRQEEEAC